MSKLFNIRDLETTDRVFPAPLPAHKTVIMVHCLATKRSWAVGKTAVDMVKEVTGWHVRDRGWKAIAYAAIIDEQGGFALGRDLDHDGDVWEETGAGAVNHNHAVIHLALSGGHGSSANDLPEQHYTPAQMDTLRALILAIEARAGRTMWKRGHNEVAAKACPGFQVARWWDSKPPRKITESRTMQGAGATAVGTLGTALAEQAETIRPLAEYSDTLRAVFVGLTVLGIGLTIWARWTDWKAGRQ
jgi:hypothetical protein